VEEKLKLDIDKANKAADHWFNAYFDEVLPGTEKLHNEIATLKARLGEEHYLSSEPVNQVYHERNMQRRAYRDMKSLYENGVLVARNSEERKIIEEQEIEATYEAVKILRPLGWRPMWRMDKAFMEPTARPFDEEIAREFLKEMAEGTAQARLTPDDAYDKHEILITEDSAEEEAVDDMSVLGDSSASEGTSEGDPAIAQVTVDTVEAAKEPASQGESDTMAEPESRSSLLANVGLPPCMRRRAALVEEAENEFLQGEAGSRRVSNDRIDEVLSALSSTPIACET
jgi:hypothetical protein